MEYINFHKYNCHGNDFIIIDNWDGAISENQLIPLSQKLAQAHWGASANGVVFINAGSNDVDFACRFFEASGQEKDFCLSAALCAAHLSVTLDIAPSEMNFKTKWGIIEAQVKNETVTLKVAQAANAEGVALIEAEGLNLAYNRINTGSPQAVAILDNLNNNLSNVAKEVLKHAAFNNEHICLNYAKINNPNSFSLKSFTKPGGQEILSNGNGIIAAALILNQQDIIKEKTMYCLTKENNEKFEIKLNDDNIVETKASVSYLFNAKTENGLFI